MPKYAKVFSSLNDPWTANELYNLLLYAKDNRPEVGFDVLLYPLPNVPDIPSTCCGRTNVAIRSAWSRFRDRSFRDRNKNCRKSAPKNDFERACDEAYDKYRMENLAMKETIMNETKNDLSAVKVGDRIFSVKYGWCEVIALRKKVDYPIVVKAESTTHSCTFEGLEDIEDLYPTFFWDEVKIVPPPRPKPPLPELAVDTPVFVGPGFTPRHFKAWGSGKIMLTFPAGRSYHTGALGASEHWGQWRLMDGSTEEDYNRDSRLYDSCMKK